MTAATPDFEVPSPIVTATAGAQAKPRFWPTVSDSFPLHRRRPEAVAFLRPAEACDRFRQNGFQFRRDLRRGLVSAFGSFDIIFATMAAIASGTSGRIWEDRCRVLRAVPRSFCETVPVGNGGCPASRK